MKRIIRTIATIIGAALIVLCVFLFLQGHHYRVIEMETQISQLGFYKKDIVLLIDNHYKSIWCDLGAVICLILGLGTFIPWIATADMEDM